MENLHRYKALFLIVSSSDIGVYEQMKKYHPMYFNQYENEIKYFFVEAREDLDQEVIEDGDTIYVKGKESITPGVYQKTMRAMEHVSKTYEFDFIVRTNLSTMWNIPNLLSMLDSKPKTGFAGGFHPCGLYFISGTCLIMSKDVYLMHLYNFLPTLYTNVNMNNTEDCQISFNLISMGIPLYAVSEFNWGFFITNPEPNTPSNIRFLDITNDSDYYSDILCFRIKHDDRMFDLHCFRVLLKKMYGIYVS